MARSYRQGEADPIVALMGRHQLQSLLPKGRITRESEDGDSSTIDLVLTSRGLTDNKIYCDLHPTDYGSDHRAIETIFSLDTSYENEDNSVPNYNFKEAPWKAIREAVRAKLNILSTPPAQID